MPSIVEASEQFQINAPREKCWKFFESLTQIGFCIPGCESVTPIDDRTANFKVKLRVGYLSRTFELKVRLKEVRAPSHLSFVGEGSDAEILGIVDMFPLEGDNSVRVTYKLEIKAASVIGKTAIGMIGKDLVRKQATQFASCVRSKLEAVEPN